MARMPKWGYKMSIKTYFCQMVTNRIDTMLPNLERAFPYFDQFVIVDGGSTDGSVEWLRDQPKVDLVEFKWCDDFPKSRNQYFKRIGELREEDEISICCVADDDEFFSDFLMKNIKQLAQEIVTLRYNTMSVRCRVVTLAHNWNRIEERLSDFWKPLIFVWEPGIHYEDPGHVVHETLIIPSGNREVKANDFADTDREIVYEHVKREGINWVRGIRNFYTCGGGHNLKDGQPLWRPFREMLSRHVDFETWPEVEKYFEKGNIAQEIKDWFVKYRKHGLPSYDSQYTEVREGFLTYFIWHHPEELPGELLEEDKDYMDYEAEAKRIHGDDVKLG